MAATLAAGVRLVEGEADELRAVIQPVGDIDSFAGVSASSDSAADETRRLVDWDREVSGSSAPLGWNSNGWQNRPFGPAFSEFAYAGFESRGTEQDSSMTPGRKRGLNKLSDEVMLAPIAQIDWQYKNSTPGQLSVDNRKERHGNGTPR
jgi:hypothetical protein